MPASVLNNVDARHRLLDWGANPDISEYWSRKGATFPWNLCVYHLCRIVMINIQTLDVPVERGQGSVAIARLIGALGRPDFAEDVYATVAAEIGIDYLSMFRIGRDGGIAFLGAAGRFKRISADVSSRYVERYCHLDPVRELVVPRLGLDKRVLVRSSASDIRHASYRRDCYDAGGIAERLCLFGRYERSLLQVNVYRCRSRPPFCEVDAARFVGLADVLVPALARHSELVSAGSRNVPDGDAIERRLRGLCPALSDRELQVCAQGLLGCSIDETARILAIASSSIITYRRRACEKLGVGSLRKLLRMIAT